MSSPAALHFSCTNKDARIFVLAVMRDDAIAIAARPYQRSRNCKSLPMKAAVLHTFHTPMAIETVRDPECPRDGAIVGVKACGVCRSDHHAWVGSDPDVELPHVMGHELAGIVEEVGPDCRTFAKGDRVTAPFILGCGHCSDCKCQQPTVCDEQAVIGFTQWGAFAQRVDIRAADYNLVRLPESISFAAAAGMGCRVTTAWRGLKDRGDLQAGEWVAVHGCGGVGLSAIMLAKALSARVVAVDISDSALVMAQQFGADACVHASSVASVWEAVRDLTGGGVHLSIDALGIGQTFDNSLRSLRKLGRHVQIGMPVDQHAQVPLPLLELVYARQLSIIGMRGLGAAGFAELLQLVDRGNLDLEALITNRIALSAVSDALQAMDGQQPAGITVINDFAS